MVVLHIGMGKTATSSLQTHVFPRIASLGLVDVYNPSELSRRLDAAVNGYGPEEGLAALAAAEGTILISNETLLEWDPLLWETSADRLLRVFGREAVILITLREPKSYLRSLYQQVLQAGKVRPPKEFFLTDKLYRGVRRFVRPGELDAINIDAFDMLQMVATYTTRFDTVLLVSFEALTEFKFLSEIWPIAEHDRHEIKRAFAIGKRVNTSYSQLAVKLTLARERLLTGLDLRTRSTSDKQLVKAFAHLRGETTKKSRSVLPSWNKLMRLLSYYGPKAVYQLPDGLYLGRHLQANTSYYEKVRRAPDGHVRYSGGQAKRFDLGSLSGACTELQIESN